MKRLVNKIGLEAEFFLMDVNNELVYPQKYNIPHDDLCILGEIRGISGETREETIANFSKSYHSVIFNCKKQNLSVNVDKPWVEINPKFYAEILRKMGTKSIATCKNVYETDILSLSDAEVKEGKIVSQKLSIGLHVHFSSCEIDSEKMEIPQYESVKIPFSVGGAEAIFDLYRKSGTTKKEVSVQANRITTPVIESIVKKMDVGMLPLFSKGMPKLKYRNPGFYETKPYGFEYRSLPFSKNVLDKVHDIVDYSFGLLESL